MHILKSIVLTSMLIILAAVQLEAKGPEASPEEQLRTKVSKLISNADGKFFADNEGEAGLEFIITPENKIVVLEVYTRSAYLEKYIKKELNYHPVRIKGIQKMTMYMLHVTFRKRS